MNFRIISLLFCLFSGCWGLSSQNNNEIEPITDFKNIEILDKVFNQLLKLEQGKSRKFNVVHIGDSHIQADLFTDIIRQALQEKFGNGGYGFTFPYSLAKTNGSRYVKYKSDVTWQSLRNIYPVSDVEIGLSGIGLYTDSDNFYIQLEVNDRYKFNTIKLLYPTNDPYFELTLSETLLPDVTLPYSVKTKGNVKYHKVKKGETLYKISHLYNIGIVEIKKMNRLKSDNLKVGQSLVINQKEFVKKEIINTTPKVILQDTLSLEYKPFYSSYSSPELLSRINILPNKKHNIYNLSGIILENDSSGIIYHSIGVNGTKASDFNKYPAFFDQLSIIDPNLIIISLGTNESFGKNSTAEYMFQMNRLVRNIRKKNKEAIFLIMTPPPSLFKRSIPNQIVEEYSKELLKLNDCVIWDLLSKMGGSSAPKNTEGISIMARDKVHYTREGYELQGNVFSSDFLNAYDNYKKTVRN